MTYSHVGSVCSIINDNKNNKDEVQVTRQYNSLKNIDVNKSEEKNTFKNCHEREWFLSEYVFGSQRCSY